MSPEQGGQPRKTHERPSPPLTPIEQRFAKQAEHIGQPGYNAELHDAIGAAIISEDDEARPPLIENLTNMCMEDPSAYLMMGVLLRPIGTEGLIKGRHVARLGEVTEALFKHGLQTKTPGEVTAWLQEYLVAETQLETRRRVDENIDDRLKADVENLNYIYKYSVVLPFLQNANLADVSSIVQNFIDLHNASGPSAIRRKYKDMAVDLARISAGILLNTEKTKDQPGIIELVRNDTFRYLYMYGIDHIDSGRFRPIDPHLP